MRVILTPSDLAFFENAPETLLMTVEPATDCDGVVCHAQGAPKRWAGLHLHLRISTTDLAVIRVQHIEIEG